MPPARPRAAREPRRSRDPDPPAAPDTSRPAHGALVRQHGQTPLRLIDLPPWHGWRYTSEAARARRFLERYLVVPTGAGAARPFRIATFQRTILSAIYDHLATFVSLPAANGKTTFLAALAIERLCRGDDFAEIDVVATKQEQAGILVEAAKRMVESCPMLADRCRWHVREQMLEYRPTGSRLRAHPAKLSAIQGLNFSLAIIDEIGFAHDETVESLIARLGKRPDARLVGIGTPGFDPNILHRLRAASLDGELPAGVKYLEWAADPGSDTFDRRAWRQANPALRAGFLTPAALEVQAALLSQREFRAYHLGIWTDTASAWLPPGAWDACPFQTAPPRGADVVLAVEGTFRRTMAVIGATLDGGIFYGWSSEAALDRDLRRVIETAADQWNVLAVVHPKRIRPALFADLAEAGIPVETWDSSPDNEATSANEFFRAIVADDVRLAHDHDELLAAHIGSVRVRYGVDGSLRLTRPDDGRFADAAFAARAAWWVANQLADQPAGAPTIY
jgi:Phage Terminase